MKSILFLLLFLPLIVFSQAHKWHGTNQDARYPDTNLMDSWPNDSLELVQTYSGIGDGYGSPSIVDDGIYIAGMPDTIGYVYKFNHQGKMLWKTEYGEDFTYKYRGSRGTPTLENGRLYYSGAHGDVLCLDMETGAKIWHVNIFDRFKGDLIKWGYTESVLIFKDLLILQPGGTEAALCGLNKATGETEWSVKLPGNANAYATPELIEYKGKTACLVNMSHAILIFDPANGEIFVNHYLDNSRENHSNENILMDGKLFYSSGYREGSVMFDIKEETNTLDTLWNNTDFGSKMSGIQVVDGIIYGTDDGKKQWAALRWEDGEIIFTTREIKPGSFVMADGKFYIFTDNGEIVLAKATSEGLDIVSRFKSPAYPAKHAYSFPVIYKGDLFIRFNNDLWRYRIKK